MNDLIGARVKRREDPRLIRGLGCYTGDLRLPGMLHVAFVRATHAHARVMGLDLAVARALPGIVAVCGPGDLPALARPLPTTMGDVPGLVMRQPAPLAKVVRYVGEAVAIVVADDPYRAADGAAAVGVEYEIVPVALDALGREGIPHVYPDIAANVAGRIARGMGDADAAFAGADRVIRERFVVARAAGAAIEPRAVVAQPGEDGGLTLWTATQAPGAIRRGVAAALGLDAEKVRVITPDVGGGFGPKGRLYGEEVALAALALRLGQPVRWEATRTEDLLTTYQGRGLIADAELAARADGTILGLRVRLTQDCGAYLATGLAVPANIAQHLLGPYRLPALAVENVVVYTNKTPLTPLRGGGRELGVYIIERLLDQLARALGRDPLDLRQQNFLRPEEFPYDTGYPAGVGGTVVYDSGDYPAMLARARELIGYDAIHHAQAGERAAGCWRGVAVTAFLEGTGSAQEEARVTVGADGGVAVTVAPPSNGQGHATTLAQLCAARLGVSLARVSFTSGDTGQPVSGGGTFGSRVATMAGNAVALAATAVAERARQLAAERLEADPRDIEIVEGIARVRGTTEPGVPLGELARAAGGTLAATHLFAPARPTAFTGGAHAAVVNVDPETGTIAIERYLVVHDCGTVINPLIVEGQIQGGVAHGLGNAAFGEEIAHDMAGRPLTTEFSSYAMPRAHQVPTIETEHRASPSPYNPEGIKGAGEGGTIGALATIVGAVEDALAPFGPTLNELPLRPEALVALWRAGR